MENSNQNEKWNRAISIIAESILKPDHELRQHAHEQECFHELMYARENVITYLNSLRR